MVFPENVKRYVSPSPVPLTILRQAQEEEDSKDEKNYGGDLRGGNMRQHNWSHRIGTVFLLLMVPMEVLSSSDTLIVLNKTDKRLFGDRFGASPTPIGIVIPPDGKHAYVANANADIVTVIDLTRWEISGRLSTGKEPEGLGWSPLP
jgi:YVTN family beta-propeller protein